MNSSRIGLLLGLVGVCALSGGAAAAPLPEVQAGFVANEFTIRSEKDVEIASFEDNWRGGVSGRFQFDNANCANDTFRIQATVAVGKSKRSVPVEVKRDDKVFHFTVDINGRDHKLPQGFKGRAVVNLTSNCKGSWSQIEVYAKK